MFTGLVETTGRIVASEAHAFGRRLTVDAGAWRGRGGALAAGDSVSVQGVCLTLAEAPASQLAFDVVAETLGATTLGDLAVGASVNLESSLTPTTPMGGHFVQGHVDGVGRITRKRADDEAHVLTVQPPNELLDYLAVKGAITLEGVSLTVAALHDEAFDVALVPTTLRETTLGALNEGDRVNLESDMIARTVVRWLRRQGEEAPRGVTWQTLREAGFTG